jgi:hypothetical protein
MTVKEAPAIVPTDVVHHIELKEIRKGYRGQHGQPVLAPEACSWLDYFATNAKRSITLQRMTTKASAAKSI